MTVKNIILSFFTVFIIIQFFRPEKNISATPSLAGISIKYSAPADVDKMLKASCYDCHSNNTKYPWYYNIQPAAWWMSNHINDGKNRINFDSFASYSAAKQYKRFDDIAEEIKIGEMPLPSYSIQHKEARLSAADKQKIYAWCDSSQNQLRAEYPPDSLKMKH